MGSRGVRVRTAVIAMSVWATWAAPAVARQSGEGILEVPLRVQEGRLIVTLGTEAGVDVDFVLGLGMSVLTESGKARLGARAAALRIGGTTLDMSDVPTTPDGPLGTGPGRPVGVIAGSTLGGFDLLIDAPHGRLLLKPVGRSVRWDGVSLSRPVAVRVLHDVLVNIDVEVGGKVFGALLDLVPPALLVNEGLRAAAGIEGDRIDSFRMGYSGWPELPVEVSDVATFRAWDPQGKGFAIVGASVAYDCALAVSWTHQEIRTCLR